MNDVCVCGHDRAGHIPRSTTTPCVQWRPETESTARWCRCNDFTPIDGPAPTRVSIGGTVAWWEANSYVVTADRHHRDIRISSTTPTITNPAVAREIADALTAAAAYLEHNNDPKGTTR